MFKVDPDGWLVPMRTSKAPRDEQFLREQAKAYLQIWNEEQKAKELEDLKAIWLKAFAYRVPENG